MLKDVSGPLFAKRYDVLTLKSRSHEIVRHDDRVALKFGKRLGCAIAEGPVTFQSVCKKSKTESRGFDTTPNLAVRRPSW